MPPEPQVRVEAKGLLCLCQGCVSVDMDLDLHRVWCAAKTVVRQSWAYHGVAVLRKQALLDSGKRMWRVCGGRQQQQKIEAHVAAGCRRRCGVGLAVAKLAGFPLIAWSL